MTPKALVITIAAILVVCSASVIAIYISRLGFGKIGPQSVRFALTCALSISLVRGWVPGRWITIILTGVGGIGSLIGGINLMTAGQPGLGLVVLGSIYTACIVALLTPFAGRHFSNKPEAEKGEETKPDNVPS